jgi:hypothetical protein
MKKFFWFSALALVFLILGISGGQKRSLPQTSSQPSEEKASQISGPLKSSKLNVDLDFGRMPLYFIANQGQVDERAAYYIQGRDKSLYFTSEGVTFILTRPDPLKKDGKAPDPGKSHAENQPREQWVVKLDFVGANPDVRPVGEEKTGAAISYFRGKPEEWHTGLPTYSRIIYANLWPGIDLAYSGTTNRLKYEFIVRPGADPSSIRLAYRGVNGVWVNQAGQLEVETPTGGFKDEKPVAFQEANGKKVDVGISYNLGEGENGCLGYGFEVGEYDRSRPLILDPALLIYCGYIGGIGGEEGRDIAVDSAGNAYIAGDTLSPQTTFPVTAGPDTIYNGGSDAFVAKVNASGAGLVYCGYIGGTGDEYGWGIAADGSGNAYITGLTSSTESSFPVIGGPDYSYNGGICDAFVAKVNASGTLLFYCGYIGGTNTDVGYDIDLDSLNCAYVAGSTNSSKAQNFPGTLVGNDLSGGNDAFVAKVNSSGSGLTWCRYIGGAYDDHGYGISVGIVESPYITGLAYSDQTSFPKTTGPNYQGSGDAFVASLGPNGTLAYCRYIGGTNLDVGEDIYADNLDYTYIAGYTASTEATNFPVTVGPDLTYNGGPYDAFVAKLKYGGTDLIYCGYIGGSGDDRAIGLSGNMAVVGYTSSIETSFPVMAGPDMSYNGGSYDAFVASVMPDGTGLSFCGYIGGSGTDKGNAIAGGIVTGITSSTEASFPVSIGPDLMYNGGSSDVFVAKIGFYTTKADFNRDGNEDILWRYYGSGGYNVVWYMGYSGGDAFPGAVQGLGKQETQSNGFPENGKSGRISVIDMLGGKMPEQVFRDAREAGGLLEQTVWESVEMKISADVQMLTDPRMGAEKTGLRVLGITYLGSASLYPVTDAIWEIAGTGDFNRDGKVDILWRYYGSGGYNVIWYMDGVTYLGSASMAAVTDPTWKIAGTGDFNRDGKVDILWRYDGPGGYNVIWYMDGPSFLGSASVAAVTDPTWKIAGTGDFNRDGKIDILWRYDGPGGYNVVWYMDGATFTGSASLYSVTDTSWKIGGVGDFNRDGKVDILWRYYGTGGYNVVWYMNGVTWVSSEAFYPVTDASWRIQNH